MNISTREMDKHIGAFAKCVNDGNAPDFCLSQVVLSASFIARGKTLEEAAARIEGGHFLHEEAPDARLARSAAKAIRALSAISQPANAHGKCAARSNVGANDPQDCDWPLCGCDEHANKVIAALEECGYLVEQPASAPAAQDEPSSNWSDDFVHENGNYMNTCATCKQTFMGHKRRFICKACYDAAHAAQGEPSWEATHQHYKGGLYRLLMVARRESDLLPLAVYESMDEVVWIRPLDEFNRKFEKLAAAPKEPTHD